MFRLFGMLLIGLVLSADKAFASTSMSLTEQQSNWASYSSKIICSEATRFSKKENQRVWGNSAAWNRQLRFGARLEAVKRGLLCNMKEPDTFAMEKYMQTGFEFGLCYLASENGKWSNSSRLNSYVQEAKRRGLSCGVGEATNTQAPSVTTVLSQTSPSDKTVNPSNENSVKRCRAGDVQNLLSEIGEYRNEIGVLIQQVTRDIANTLGFHFKDDRGAKVEGVLISSTYPNGPAHNILRPGDIVVRFGGNPILNLVDLPCFAATQALGVDVDLVVLRDRKWLNLTIRPDVVANNLFKKSKSFETELSASERETERLRQELAALKAQQEQQRQTSSGDIKLPTITIASAITTGAQGIIRGRVNDDTGVAELRVNGQKIAVDSNGNFSATTYVPEGGTSVNIEAIDLAGLSSIMSVRVDRATTQTASISFDRLNPLKRKAAINNDALALVIGVSDYKETNAKAIYADSDAKVFQDYAIEKLGVPRNRVKTLVNDGADEKDMLLATKRWLARAAKQGKTDVYIFFAGHGLASDDGSKMYLLPYDGAPELLDDTAILRDRLFSDVAAANPRSVTVFLDTCYSGTTRGTDMLIASRPIAIRALEQSIPDNFTVMTAAAGDQTAKPLEEAKHGMFSYFLMKGMEGEADANNDNEITAGELHNYVEQNVWQQSSNTQLPQIQGNRDKVLVRFQ